MKHTLGTFLANKRKQMGVTQAQLSENAEISASYIAKVELDTVFPSPQKLIAFMDCLELEASDIIEIMHIYVYYIGFSESKILQREFLDSKHADKLFKYLFNRFNQYKYTEDEILYTDSLVYAFVHGVINFFISMNESYSIISDREDFQVFILLLHIFKDNFNQIGYYAVNRSDSTEISNFIEQEEIDSIDENDKLSEDNEPDANDIELYKSLEAERKECIFVGVDKDDCHAGNVLLNLENVEKPQTLINSEFYFSYASYDYNFPLTVLFLEENADKFINKITLNADINIQILKEILQFIDKKQNNDICQKAYSSIHSFLLYMQASLIKNNTKDI